MPISGESSRGLRPSRTLVCFVREQGFYECSLNTAVSFPIYGQRTKCNMRFLYIPRPICRENPLIFVDTSLLLIQNGKEKKKESEKKEKDGRNSTSKKATKGKNAGEKRTINPFFCCSSSCICEQLSQLLVKLYLNCCQHEFSKNQM